MLGKLWPIDAPDGAGLSAAAARAAAA